MYKLKPTARQWDPIAGVPWRDMPDDEFAAVEAAYDAQFSSEQKGALRNWFTHVDDAKQPRPTSPAKEQ